MPIANMRDLIQQARGEGRAVGAFSVSSIDMVRGAVLAAEMTATPIILQVAEVRLPFSPLSMIGPAMLAAAREATVPVSVHLDHGQSIDVIKQALDIGFTSVMFDGSNLSMDENMKKTQQVIALAKAYGAAVEAEIGSVGKTESGGDAPAVCARPEDCVRFTKDVNVDALAVAIGNAHGVYVGAPKLHFEILSQIQGICDTPLVLHGGTGISDDDFRHCISLGMHKINIATATFLAVTAAAQGASDYFDMAGHMVNAAERVVTEHIELFGRSKQ